MTLVLHNSSNISSIEINFLPALIGSLIGFTSFLSIFANLTILIVLLHSNLIKSNPLYILSSLNLFNDIFHGFGFLVFLAPTSFAQVGEILN
ncbi:hypothetical protein Mgra_00007994 [Meloidogyne graminicola]|uniref:Uncharacterized protein n=1 Tax=Meloidogyne graminicola TaxID=189291 RepID=A0A8S9ZHB1_9BILA|nr:hypothetical protein Mgra_00007994 [Meloidogyne graminicola]